MNGVRKCMAQKASFRRALNAAARTAHIHQHHRHAKTVKTIIWSAIVFAHTAVPRTAVIQLLHQLTIFYIAWFQAYCLLCTFACGYVIAKSRVRHCAKIIPACTIDRKYYLRRSSPPDSSGSPDNWPPPASGANPASDCCSLRIWPTHNR